MMLAVYLSASSATLHLALALPENVQLCTARQAFDNGLDKFTDEGAGQRGLRLSTAAHKRVMDM